jgi:hypothetical protein
LRARIVLACTEGGNNLAVAARLGVSRSTVGMWRARFLAPTSVHRIWRAFGLQPNRTESFKISPDTALDTATGKVIGRQSTQHRAVDFRDFLDEIDRQVEPAWPST